MSSPSKSTTTTNSTTQPWEPAQGNLFSVLGGLNGIDWNLNQNQSGAIDSLVNSARGGNPFSDAISKFASSALTGGPDRSGTTIDAYNGLVNNLSPTARGDYLDPSKNPFFGATTSAIGNDVQNRLTAMYAGAGRDPSGAGGFGGQLGKEIASATAPIFAQVYGNERGNQINAANSLYGAGANTSSVLSGLDAQRFATMGMGTEASNTANNAAVDPYNRILDAEARREGIPLSVLQQIAGIATPIAGLGSQTQGTSTTTQPHGLFDWIKMLGSMGGGGGNRSSTDYAAAYGGY